MTENSATAESTFSLSSGLITLDNSGLPSAAKKLVPSFLNLGSTTEMTLKPVTISSGQIVGQILKNINSISSMTGNGGKEKQPSGSTFVPFHFQHPFPGSGTVATATEPQEESQDPPTFLQQNSPGKADTLCIKDFTKQTSASKLDLSMATQKNKSESESEIKIVTLFPPQSLTQPNVVTNVKLDKDGEPVLLEFQCPSNPLETVEAEIVNIDPVVFNQEQTKLLQTTLQGSSSMEMAAGHQTKLGQSNNFTLSAILAKVSSQNSESSNNTQTKTISGTEEDTNEGQGSSRGHMTGRGPQVSSFTSQGRFVCEICHAQFPEYHQLILHGNIHLMENNRLKCEMCGQKFRSHLALGKHVVEHKTEDVSGETNAASSRNPRPFKCEACDIAFRVKCHLLKHFRSRVHFINLEILGKLPKGTWEKVKDHVADLDVSDNDSFIESVQSLISSLENKKVIVETLNTVGQTADVFVEARKENDDDVYDGEPLRAFPIRETVSLGNDSPGETDETEGPKQEKGKLKPHLCGLCRRGFESVALLKVKGQQKSYLFHIIFGC